MSSTHFKLVKKNIVLYFTDDTNLPLLLATPVPKSIKLLRDYVCESTVNCTVFTSRGDLIVGCHEGIYVYDTIFDLNCCTTLPNVTAVATINNKIYYIKTKGMDAEDSTVTLCDTDMFLAQHNVLVVLPGEAERYSLAVGKKYICMTDKPVNTVSFYNLKGVGLWTVFLHYIPGAICTSPIEQAVFISDPDNNKVHKYSVKLETQKMDEVWQCTGDWTLPTQLCADLSGVLYVKGVDDRGSHHKAISIVSMEGMLTGASMTTAECRELSNCPLLK